MPLKLHITTSSPNGVIKNWVRSVWQTGQECHLLPLPNKPLISKCIITWAIQELHQYSILNGILSIDGVIMGLIFCAYLQKMTHIRIKGSRMDRHLRFRHCTCTIQRLLILMLAHVQTSGHINTHKSSSETNLLSLPFQGHVTAGVC